MALAAWLRAQFVVNSTLSIPVAELLGACIAVRADLNRRRFSLTQVSSWHVLTLLDVLCPAVISAIAAGSAAALIPTVIARRAVPIDSPSIWTVAAGILIFIFVWGEGRREIQFQRPPGIVLGESLILAGIYGLTVSLAFSAEGWLGLFSGNVARLAWALPIVGGAATIAIIVPPFAKGYEGHRILERVAEQGELVQGEYMPPTPECPHPELWQMVDTQTSELEVLDFLKSLVTTLKPQLIVETGTFLGYSTIKMAEGLKANGFGRIITIEYDPAIFAKAKERIDASGLGKWIEYRNESSLDARIEGTIDLLFSDSHLPIREQEIRRFLPQIDPRGLILVHDASSEFGIVRDAVIRLEKEGLISTVLVSTPRGLAISQKREGRR